ncbi:MAG: hypothetical protein ACKOU6_18255, partial [Planctomycetota bacterium]
LVGELRATMAPSSPALTPPQEKKETRLAQATITLFSCGGEGSCQQRKRDSQKKTPLKGRTADAVPLLFRRGATFLAVWA